MITSFMTDGHYPILIPYGCACLLAHILLYGLFRYILPPGPWGEVPSFTAHQAVALVLMIQWTVQGIQNLNATASHDGPAAAFAPTATKELHYHYDRYDVLRPIPAGLEMAQRSMGALWIWDIPVTMLSKDMAGFDPLMHAHHLGMFLITCIVLGFLSFDSVTDGGGYWNYGWPVGSCYAPVFLGVVELSSIPLQVVDLFHPKKAPCWHAYMESSPLLSHVNELARISFALLFLAVRGVLFPYVVVTAVLPQCLAAYRGLYPNPLCLPIGIVLVFSAAFTALQLHWATLVLKQIARALGPGPGGGAGGDVNSTEGGNDQQRTGEKIKKDE
jgi:hypothetical protein